VIEQISFHQGRRDEGPNIQLAESLVAAADTKGIAEIANGLDDADEAIANDCIKVLYEVGYRKPQLIVPYANLFLSKLKSKNNRMVWGACIALSHIAVPACETLYRELDTLIKVYEKGSVITRDNCVSIFAGIIVGNRKFSARVFPLIIEHLRTCRPKEVGQHAERAFVCIDKTNAEEFKNVLMERYDALIDSQKKRVDALLRKIEKLK
jgi:hypothetical protein